VPTASRITHTLARKPKSLQPLGHPGRLITVGEVALGDQTAFEEAYREHSLALTRLAWLLVGSREKAEDAVHEVFLRYLRVDPPPDSHRQCHQCSGSRARMDSANQNYQYPFRPECLERSEGSPVRQCPLLA
jgi:hypothetical protein